MNALELATLHYFVRNSKKLIGSGYKFSVYDFMSFVKDIQSGYNFSVSPSFVITSIGEDKLEKSNINTDYITLYFTQNISHIEFTPNDNENFECCQKSLTIVSKKISKLILPKQCHRFAINACEYIRHCRTITHISNMYKIERKLLLKNIKLFPFISNL